MGNFFDCTRRNPQGIPPNKPQMSFVSTTSITNLSTPSRDTNLTVTPHVSLSSTLSAKFSWNRLQRIYVETLETSHELKLQPAVLSVMSGIFCKITNNIGLMSQKFYECLTETDKAFPTYFEECATKNTKSYMDDNVLVEKIRNHVISTIQVHSIIINCLNNSNTAEANNTMKLIAISHLLMKVKSTYFNLMDVVMVKFLLRSGFLNEENAEAITLYFNFITSYIIKNIEVQTANQSKRNSSSVARENYRQMKKWHSFVEKLHTGTSKLQSLDSVTKISIVESSSSCSTVPTEILKQDACLMKHFVKKKIIKRSVTN